MTERAGLSLISQFGLALAGGAILLGGLAFLTRNETPAPPAAPVVAPISAETAPAQPDAAMIDAFNKAIKAEPKVIDFVYDPQAVFQWTIGVRNDGSPRFGYAEYFCNLMSEKGLPRAGAKVRIVDYQHYIDSSGDARGASLGSVDCETSEHMTP